MCAPYISAAVFYSLVAACGVSMHYVLMSERHLQANFYKCHVNSAPVKPMQHPLHYPHGTLFMAPGPAGQTAALPADKGLRRLMLREWHNYNVIFSSYNFDYKPASDSLMAKAMRWWDKQQALRKREEALEAKIADQQMRR